METHETINRLKMMQAQLSGKEPDLHDVRAVLFELLQLMIDAGEALEEEDG